MYLESEFASDIQYANGMVEAYGQSAFSASVDSWQAGMDLATSGFSAALSQILKHFRRVSPDPVVSLQLPHVDLAISCCIVRSPPLLQAILFPLCSCHTLISLVVLCPAQKGIVSLTSFFETLSLLVRHWHGFMVDEG